MDIEKDIKSFFRLTPYRHGLSDRRRRYPTYRIRAGESIFFPTLEEAEERLAYRTSLPECGLYCWVLSELPYGIDLLEGESFMERVYLPDGQLWSERSYADMSPREIPPQYGEIEFDNYIYDRGFFPGRKPAEIRFKQGDLIEVFCYSGNYYWSDGYVELAIVVGTPPTVEEIGAMAERHLKQSKNLTGDTGFDLGIKFNRMDDAYAVIPAYVNAKWEGSLIDHCPTHCAMAPGMNVSERMRKKLESLRMSQQDFIENIKHSKKRHYDYDL